MMPRPRTSLWTLGACAAAALLAACGGRPTEPPAQAASCPEQPVGEVILPAGPVILGAAAVLPGEGPPRAAQVGAFAIDRTEVTNAEFARFVEATGYVTLAERAPDPALYPGVPASELKPSSLVFVGAAVDPKRTRPDAWWRIVEGASWRRPEGLGSDLRGRERLPVVHVGYEDALAYARWRGRDLPTEAEWEYAARAGLEAARFEWGDDAPDPAAAPANYWQGVFPAIDTGEDGYKARAAPVGCFPPSRYGLHDMSGNVWEWTKTTLGGGDGATGAPHVIKGGSFLCSEDYCFRYRPAARQPGPPDTGGSHIGFRTVRRLPEAGRARDAG